MPWLTSTDELPQRPCRVLIAGSTGAGKSTLARAVARQLRIDHFEIDALYHGPGWVPQPSFQSSVKARIAASTWVTEWQYSSVQSRLADRADLMVWLDLPRQTVMRSVIRRTIRRSLSGAQLWNGNQEPALGTILTDHDHIIRWAWRTHHPRRKQIQACVQARPHLNAVTLRHRDDATTWLTGPLARAATRI